MPALDLAIASLAPTPASSAAVSPAARVSPAESRSAAAAQDFEAFFLSHMLASMFQGLGEKVDPMFGGGQAEQLWKSFMTDEYGRQFARQGGLGLADKILATTLQAQMMGEDHA
jgi:Rod binding domain-containing protein